MFPTVHILTFIALLHILSLQALFLQPRFLKWCLNVGRNASHSLNEMIHDCHIFPTCKILTKKQCMWDSIKMTQELRMFLGGHAQLSSSREQFWVSNGNLLKSIAHREVTVILQ